MNNKEYFGLMEEETVIRNFMYRVNDLMNYADDHKLKIEYKLLWNLYDMCDVKAQILRKKRTFGGDTNDV